MVDIWYEGEEEIKKFSNMNYIIMLKKWVYEEAGLTLQHVRHLNEIAIGSIDEEHYYHNIISMKKDENLEIGLMNAQGLLDDLNKIPDKMPEDVKSLVDKLKNIAKKVIETNKDALLLA